MSVGTSGKEADLEGKGMRPRRNNTLHAFKRAHLGDLQPEEHGQELFLKAGNTYRKYTLLKREDCGVGRKG